MYSFQLTRECKVIETINIDVEAESQNEAQDLAYEVASTHPFSGLVVDRLTITSRDYRTIDNINFVEEEEDNEDTPIAS